MNQKDQENLEEINRRESIIKQDEADRSISSNPRILIKFPKIPVDPSNPSFSAAEAAASFQVEEITKTHHCKECGKSFSSGKALGGHMSSAHVQGNKDYPYKKLKSKMMMKAHLKYSGSGPADIGCVVCGKRFPSQKSLYGHMRCHPDRDWRGMEPPGDTGIESSEASTGFEYTCPDKDGDENGKVDEDVDSGRDAVPWPVDFVDSLKGWPVKARRGRSACNRASSSEEEAALSNGQQLLRLLKCNLDSGCKEIGGEVEDVAMMSSNMLARQRPESDGEVGFKNHSLANLRPGLESSVNCKKPIFCRIETDNGPGPESKTEDRVQARDYKTPEGTPKVKSRNTNTEGDRVQARDYKRRKSNPRTPMVKIWNTNGIIDGEKIEYDFRGKGKCIVLSNRKKSDKGEREDELYIGAITVLANGKREKYTCRSPDTPIPIGESSARPKQTPEKLGPAREMENSGLSSPEKYICSTCKKAFQSPQALGGHRSSHNKFRMEVYNTNDNIGASDDNIGPETKPRKGIEKKQVDEDYLHVCKICDRRFASARALGGHKKCHNSAANGDEDKYKHKIVRGFDLNMMPDQNGDEDNENISGDHSEL